MRSITRVKINEEMIQIIYNKKRTQDRIRSYQFFSEKKNLHLNNVQYMA